MILKNTFYIAIFVLASLATTAQTIHLEFPYFAGKTYDFTIFQGDKRITLISDTIPQGGKVQLHIPKKYEGYKGIAQWYFTNSATGGGLDLIINNEDFLVSCLDSIPTNENIIYTNTQENLFDKRNYQKQQELFEKHDAMLATKRAYNPNNKFYKLASKEYNSLIKQYDVYSNALQQSTLYAAKFRQIVNLTMGIGTIITLDENEKAININNFITNELDFAVLYTSNHWGGIIKSWVQLQTMVIKDDAKMIADATTILNRIKSDTIYTDFVVNLTKELSKAGKDQVLIKLVPVVKNSKQLLYYDGVLNVYKQDLLGKAPHLIITDHSGKVDDQNYNTRIVKTDELNSKYTLLLFYQSGCGPCEETLESLLENYKDLTANGFKIISIAADTDKGIFKNTSSQLPWPDNYCDFEGMNGVNFKNYAVIGTPTMYILDEKGMIQAKIATVDELLHWSNANSN